MGKVAFVFAGQGSQFPGMGKELYETSSAARSVFDRADTLHPGLNELCFNGSAEDLNQTLNTQPCLFVMDCACAAAVAESGITADCCAGFSLGELAALAYAGAMDFDDAFNFVLSRAEAMQVCSERVRGVMGAVLRLTSAQVEAICEQFPCEAYPVNYNCPGQTVVSCKEEVWDSLAAKVAEAKGRIMRLKVSGAFHTPWMAEATRTLMEILTAQPLKPTRIPVYANVNAQPYDSDGAELLSKQASNPVRWQTSIEHMMADGVDTFIELGAGKTLSGLIHRIDASVKVFNVEKPEDIDKLKEAGING